MVPIVQVSVNNNDVERALRVLKKRATQERLPHELKARQHFTKPSDERRQARKDAIRRYRKMLRKRIEREGY